MRHGETTIHHPPVVEYQSKSISRPPAEISIARLTLSLISFLAVAGITGPVDRLSVTQ
jgi:hypothetical protein